MTSPDHPAGTEMVQTMLDIQGWTVGPFAENPYLLACADTGQAVFIDPGDAPERLIRAIDAARVTISAILLTHAHLDHVGALTEVRAKTGAPVYLHSADDLLLLDAPRQWQAFGKRIGPIAPAEFELRDGDVISFGRCELQVIHTPGHTPGCVCFYAAADNLLIAGDTLFFQSVGRTDLPGGSSETLHHSIRTRLWHLPDTTRVLPGHGPPTSIGDERAHNPFVGERTHAT
jgi:glyoxylase-like metal-dependent hydrolase (beta-lactamase superfamily II)